MAAQYINTKADNHYFFKVLGGMKWREVGRYNGDAGALQAIYFKEKYRETGGRLGVKIGDYIFPVSDMEPGGRCLTCKPRKSYQYSRGNGNAG